MQFVRMPHARGVEGGLVERTEHDCVDLAFCGQIQGQVQIGEGGAPGSRRNPGHRDVVRVNRGIVVNWDIGRCPQEPVCASTRSREWLTPACACPISKTGTSPTRRIRARSMRTGLSRRLATSSGPMPPGSPGMTPMRGFIRRPRKDSIPGGRARGGATGVFRWERNAWFVAEALRTARAERISTCCRRVLARLGCIREEKYSARQRPALRWRCVSDQWRVLRGRHDQRV